MGRTNGQHWTPNQIAYLEHLGLSDPRVDVNTIAARYVRERKERTVAGVEARVWKLRRERRKVARAAPLALGVGHRTRAVDPRSTSMLNHHVMEQALQVCLSVSDLDPDQPDPTILREQVTLAADVRDAMLRAGIFGLITQVQGAEGVAPTLTAAEQQQVLALLWNARQTLSEVADNDRPRPDARARARALVHDVGNALQQFAVRALLATPTT